LSHNGRTKITMAIGIVMKPFTSKMYNYQLSCYVHMYSNIIYSLFQNLLLQYLLFISVEIKINLKRIKCPLVNSNWTSFLTNMLTGIITWLILNMHWFFFFIYFWKFSDQNFKTILKNLPSHNGKIFKIENLTNHHMNLLEKESFVKWKLQWKLNEFYGDFSLEVLKKLV
jgi:hypothetical protein